MGSVDPAHHPPQRFPDAAWDWFVARCEALGIPEPGPRRPVLEALYGHLVGVNRWLNLTTLVQPEEYLKWHVLDSLSLIGDRRLAHLSEGAPCVDLGSGGGYPGLPLALWYPRIRWVLADARQKKAAFLAAAAALVGPQVSARHWRGGQGGSEPVELVRRCQLVVSRAMGQAATVLQAAAALIERSGHLVIYKGPAYAAAEASAAAETAQALGLAPVHERRVRLEPGDPERVLAIFTRVR